MLNTCPHGFFIFLFLIFSTAATRAQKGFDAERFLADNFIVDGLGSYYIDSVGNGAEHPYPTPMGTWDFKPLKRETGCNMIIMGYSMQTFFEREAVRLAKTTYKNAGLISTFSDVSAIRTSGKFGVLMLVQSPYRMGGNVNTLGEWYKRGQRVFQLAYGTQYKGQAPEDVMGYGYDQEGGLTLFGEKVIAELNRLGMIIDVSHCNEQTTMDACRISKAPVVCTHTGAKSLTNLTRNKSDQTLKVIAATGGIVGVSASGLITEKRGARGVPQFCDHLDHIKSLIGVEKIAVATDPSLQEWERGFGRSSELSEIGRWKHVAAELHRRGYKEEELKKIFGLNWASVFKKVLKP